MTEFWNIEKCLPFLNVLQIIYRYQFMINFSTVKSFNFVDTEFFGFMTLDMFMDTCICGFQIICSSIFSE